MAGDLGVVCLSVDDVARYVGDSLASTVREELASHVERCESCRATVAAAVRAARTTEPQHDDVALPTGTRVGRYVVSSLLGAGGLGRVYAAYDPELDRKVALKLVRDPALATGEALARLTREAQLTARLSHPNVVAVHDVGTFGTQVFVAMELVAGETLRTWLAAEPRDWRDVLAIVRQAGEGLAAAHAAGLVHRDIKPDNILIGRDGRARVGDFGLARELDDANSAAPVGKVEVVTREGTVLGTPAYMSPEQLRGRAVDARSDQFSFCVTLYEALYRERPFAGATLEELAVAIEAGEPRAIKADAPAWLRALVVRGLSARPEARYPTMEALNAALAHDPRVRRRRISLAFGGAALLAGATVAWSLRSGEAPCAGSSSIDAWNGTQRAAIETAFRASHRPFAELAIRGVETAFDRYATKWAALHLDVCEATFVRHEQSAELLDRRNGCLEERRAALATQIELFAHADVSLVDRAIRLATELPALEPCSDRTTLLATVALPTDLGRRAQVQPLRGKIAAAEVLERSARYPDAGAAVTALRPIVSALGYPPLAAMLDEVAGSLAEDLHDTAGAIASFDRAALEAEAGGDDVAKARALIGAGRVRGMANQAPDIVARSFEQAKAALTRVGDPPELAVRLELAIGGVALIRGDFAAVEPHDRAAVALAERAYGRDDIRTASARGELAGALERLGKYDEAAAAASAAIDVLSRQLGPAHPRTSLVRGVWGQILFDQAKYDEAIVQQQLILDATRALLGHDATDTWTALSDLARSHEGKNEFREALALYEEARAVVDRSYGPNHPNSALIRVNVAAALLELQRNDEAVAMEREAIARSVAAVGRDNIFAANAQNGIAQAWRVSHPAEALVAAQESLRLFRALEGDEHPDVGRGYDSLGRVLEQLGRHAEAVAALERALAIREKAMGADHPDTADSRFELATLVAKTDPARAIALATAAGTAFEAAGDHDSATKISDWLKTRQRTR